MKSNTEFNHYKLKLDNLYLSQSGGKVKGKTTFTAPVTFSSGDPKYDLIIKDKRSLNFADNLDLNADNPVDADLIITKKNADGTWYQKTFGKIWDYIKLKIGINTQGSTDKFLNEKGSFTVPPVATKASTLGRPQDAQAMTFNWVGQSGQPTWVFGGNDPGTSIYVYNPANFSVNYATSAGTCSKAMLHCFISGVTVYCAPNQSTHGLGVNWGDTSAKQNFYCLRQSWPLATWGNGAVVSPAVEMQDDVNGMKIAFTSTDAQNYSMQAKFFYQLT